jgi:hypothetical protein
MVFKKNKIKIMIKHLNINEKLKTTKEVLNLLGNETFFEFDFFTENTIFLKSLEPIFNNGMLCDFELSFYYDGADFFRHCKLINLIDKNKLQELVLVNKENNEKATLFFQRYDENK